MSLEKKISTSSISTKMSGKFVSWMELFAKTSLGQNVLKLCDRTLLVIEKTTQWSVPVPPPTFEENGKILVQVYPTGNPERPLPWVLFIPTLIILRLVRFAINIGAWLMGHPQIGPEEVIKCMQNARRSLRSIKSQGLKIIREKNPEATVEQVTEDKPKKPKKEENEKIEEDSGEESLERVEEVLQKIERLVEEASEDDEDYVPSGSGSDSSSVSEEEVEVPEDEVEKLIEERTEDIENVRFEKRDASPGRVNSKGHYPAEKYELDGDVTFYSPISSTSDSPERSGTPIKHPKDPDNRRGDHKGSEENGGMHYVTPCVELEKLLCSSETSDNVRNGRSAERRQGKSKSHHKHKRSNCASRKKK